MKLTSLYDEKGVFYYEFFLVKRRDGLWLEAMGVVCKQDGTKGLLLPIHTYIQV